MDPNLSETIEKLKTENRIIARKLLELSNSVKNSFKKMENKLDDKMEYMGENLMK